MADVFARAFVMSSSHALSHRVVRALGSRLSTHRAHGRLERMRAARAATEHDAFGMHPDWVRLGHALIDPLYRHYFRVRAYGAEHIPANGPAILIANHGGTLPFDAMMLCADVLQHTEPPRLLRPITDRVLPRMPFIGHGVSRVGAVSGALGNVRHLLEQGELCAIFPEGLAAIGKTYAQRYQLRPFRVGFAELALRLRVPVLPVAIIGPEDQWPVLAHVDALHPFGLPYIPLPATPLPLPVRYHIHYGEPLALDTAQLGRPITRAAIEQASERAHDALRALIEHGLAQRRGVFR